uniref:Uncharacterized protein n=1 Tax=Prymnesium polylepis TaxID=72548 RepID=A0A7S4N2U2_9EUKA
MEVAAMQCLSCAATLLVVHGVAAAPKLHDAASQNNDHTIQAFLDAGADLNLRDPATGQTPLMFSVLNGFAASVRYLLSAGADTSIGENDGYTPLHGAAFQGRADIAKILIDHGLDPNEVHSDGYTPLHRAVLNGHTDTVKALLNAEVPVDQPTADGKIAMELAETLDMATPVTKAGRRTPGVKSPQLAMKEVLQKFTRPTSGEKSEL